MIAKLATALGLTRAELEMELKKSVEGIYIYIYIIHISCHGYSDTRFSVYSYDGYCDELL